MTMIEPKSTRPDFEQNSPYLELINASPDGFVVVDGEGIILFANPRATELLQRSSSEILGKELGLPIVEGENSELELPGKDGSQRNVEMRTIELTWSGKEAFLINLRDITEQKRAETELKKHQELLEETGEMARVGGWEVDLQTNKPYWTKETRRIHDVPDDYEPSLEDALNFFPGESGEQIRMALNEAIQKGKPYDLTLQFITYTGKQLWVRTQCKPELFRGECIRLSGVFQDVSDIKQYEMALQESEEKFRMALSDSSIILWQQDHDLKYTWIYNAHPAFSAGDIIGKTDEEIIENPEDARYLTRLKRKVLESGEKVNEEVETRLDGGPYYYKLNIEPRRDLKGKIIGITCVSVNITELKLALKELKEAKEKAEGSDKLKTAFLTNISHEIRTPMNGIMGFTDLLKNPDLKGDKQEEYIDIIQKSSRRMLNIINELVDISKIESGQTEIHREDLQVSRLMDEVCQFYQPEAEKKGLLLKKGRTLSEHECTIRTDVTKVNQVLSNLIKNAVTFTKEGEIEVGCSKEDKFFQFYVKDTGIGISPEMHEAIFDRFRQVEMSISSEYEGAGLGLSISKSFIEMLGGSMWVDSMPGKGSTFYFNLPYEAPQILKEEDETNVLQNGTLKGLVVLVVDDDPISFNLLKEMMVSRDIQLIYAQNGKEAIEMMENENPINLILMDLKMPVMDGLTATKIIKKKFPGIPIIAQTAFASKFDRRIALETGCDDYLIKPIKQRKLMEILQAHNA